MATRVKKEESNQPEKKVYCGPNLPGLSQFMVFEKLPKSGELHIEACPEVEKLIVAIDKLNHTRLKLSVKGSYEQKVYKDILKYIGGVK